MKTKYRILFCLLLATLATATFVYAEDDDEGDEETPASMVGTDCTECHGDKYASQAGTTGGQTSGSISIPASMVGTDCTQCHGNKYAGLIGTTGTIDSSSEGATLYQSYCARCHGALSNSEVSRASASSISSAISSNKGGMSSVSSLSSAQISSIASALSGNSGSSTGTTTTPPVQPPTTPPVAALGDGASLYQINCAACHGPLSASGKRGATALGIQTAIFNNWGGMGYLSQLTLAQTQSISGALQQVSTPTTAGSADGVSLYLVTCAGCHGPLSTSGVRGASATSIQSAIFSNWGGMGYLAGLSGVQIMDIAAKLATPATAAPALSQPTYPAASVKSSAAFAATPAPAAIDGVSLYASKCASCHGPLASSNKARAGAGNIQSAIDSNDGGMGFLSTLSAAQVDAIAAALY